MIEFTDKEITAMESVCKEWIEFRSEYNPRIKEQTQSALAKLKAYSLAQELADLPDDCLNGRDL